MQDKFENLIINGRKKVIEKRQNEIGPKLTKIINDYELIEKNNKEIFASYHNSFNNIENIDIVKYFSDEINKLDINEFDLELIVDYKNDLTLADYIIINKPYLSLKNFSIGGSNEKLGYKFLEKIFLSNDKEYIKYLPLIGFKGSPKLYLMDINGKKIIDYLIENYELYNNYCNNSFNLLISDYQTKQYILENINKYISNLNKDKFFKLLDSINFTVKELISNIKLNNKQTSVFEIYLNNDILKDRNKLNNIVMPNKILLNLIYKYMNTNNDRLKNEIKNCINNLYADDSIKSILNGRLLSYLKSENIILKSKNRVRVDDDILFSNYIKELQIILKSGIPTKKKVIDYVVSNYINMYKNNKTIALKEINVLILVKKNNPNFHIEDSNVGPNFDNDTIHLVLSDKNNLGWHNEDNGATFNHEMTHAIQYYCFNDDTPQEFYQLLPNEKILKNISQFCINLINKMKEDINGINNNDYEKLVSNISLNKYSYDREVVDIFDSIFCFTDILMQLEYKDIELIEGHPYDYMKYGGYDFSEILADYKSLWTSDRKDLFEFVKTNLGLNLTKFLEDFYISILDCYIELYDINKKVKNKKKYKKCRKK